MEISIEQYNSIQRYLNGEMSAAEEAGFEKELETDKTLKAYYIFEIGLRESLEATGSEGVAMGPVAPSLAGQENDASMRSIIARAGQDWMQTKQPKKIGSRATVLSFGSWAVAAAASIILIIGAVVWLSPHTNNTPSLALNPMDSGGGLRKPPGQRLPEAEKADLAALYQANFERDPAPGRKPHELTAALTDYEKKQYATLQGLDLNDLPKVRSGSDDINSNRRTKEIGHYFKGLSFMETRNFIQARQDLGWVLDSAHDAKLIGKAQWYLALVYLKEKNTTGSVDLLKKVKDNPDAILYHRRAAELLDALEK